MGRRLRCSSVRSHSSFTLLAIWLALATVKLVRPPRALPAAHFERNDVTIICETVH